MLSKLNAFFHKLQKEEQGTPQYSMRQAVPDYKQQGYEQRRKILNFLLLNVGTVIVAVGIHFFKYPNNFALGGVSGISVVLAALVPNVSPASIALIINVVLLVVALIAFGRGFAGKTFYASMMLSLLLVLFDRVIPITGPLTQEGLLELFIAIMLSAFGGAILFNLKASSGGTDIVAMLIKKYTNAEIGQALFYSDLIITVSTFFIFDIRTGLLSATGLVLKGAIVDRFISQFNRVKYFTIITSKPEEVGEFITTRLKRSSTRLEGVGVYTGEERSVFISAVDVHQASILKEEIKRLDPSAFVMISTSSEISGRGFRSGF